MAAFRERHSARDGVGHADRPWFHDAIGLDAQSRGLCLSSARRCKSNTYTNGVPECYTYSDSYGNSNPHGDCHSYGNSDTDTDTETYTLIEGYTVAEAASYAAAATIARS
jgi:hypothetical protein